MALRVVVPRAPPARREGTNQILGRSCVGSAQEVAVGHEEGGGGRGCGRGRRGMDAAAGEVLSQRVEQLELHVVPAGCGKAAAGNVQRFFQ